VTIASGFFERSLKQTGYGCFAGSEYTSKRFRAPSECVVGFEGGAEEFISCRSASSTSTTLSENPRFTTSRACKTKRLEISIASAGDEARVLQGNFNLAHFVVHPNHQHLLAVVTYLKINRLFVAVLSKRKYADISVTGSMQATTRPINVERSNRILKLSIR
jgi:hypothetical protein